VELINRLYIFIQGIRKVTVEKKRINGHNTKYQINLHIPTTVMLLITDFKQLIILSQI
jgi:hypothetical protein